MNFQTELGKNRSSNKIQRAFQIVFNEETGVRLAVPDIVILLFFAAITFGIFSFLWRGAAPELTIAGDAANIAGFAAATDHPDLFAGDELLNSHSNFAFYRTIHIPLLRWLSKYAGGYGQAFLWLSWPHMLLHAAGFYFLGIAVFRVRSWAVIFSFVTLWFGLIPAVGELWGIYKDPLPRITFQSLLPFLLAAAYIWRDKPGRWPWLLAAAGLLTYVHPPSAPAWGMALWCGFLFYLPKAWSFPRKLFFMLGAGCAFLIAAGPFIATYFENHSHSPSGDYGQIISIMKASYSRGLLDIPHAILDFANTISFKSGPGTRMIVPSLLLPGAICGFFAIAKIQKIKAEQYQLLWGWLLGFVSAVVPLAEHEICRRLSMAPIEISFIRGLRYLVPLCMLFCIWPLAEMHRNCRSDIARKRILWIGILAAVLWAALHPPPGVARNIWRTAMTGQFEPLVRQQAELKQAMDFIRDEVAPGTRIFVAPPGRYALAARYYALKPVVFCSKDRNAFAFANHDKLIQWDHRWKEYNAVFHRPARGRLGGLIELAAQLDAEVLFIDKRTTRIGSADAKAQLLFENDEFFIITLNGLSVKEPEPLHSEKKRAAQTGVPGVGDSDK